MLPYEKERIKKKLIQAGFFRHRVERMKPWTLLDCLKMVKGRKTVGFSSGYITPYAEPSFVHSSMLAEMWSNTVVKNSRKTARENSGNKW